MGKEVNKKAKSASVRRRLTFRYKARPGSDVSIAGSFNDWAVGDKVLKDKNSTGDYSITMLLAKGIYEYKFCVNGKWCVDPDNPNFKANPHGTLNSFIEVV